MFGQGKLYPKANDNMPYIINKLKTKRMSKYYTDQTISEITVRICIIEVVNYSKIASCLTIQTTQMVLNSYNN